MQLITTEYDSASTMQVAIRRNQLRLDRDALRRDGEHNSTTDSGERLPLVGGHGPITELW
jgi:hypothetical protein